MKRRILVIATIVILFSFCLNPMFKFAHGQAGPNSPGPPHQGECDRTTVKMVTINGAGGYDQEIFTLGEDECEDFDWETVATAYSGTGYEYYHPYSYRLSKSTTGTLRRTLSMEL